MSTTLQTMYDEMRRTWEDMKNVVDVQDKEIKSVGEVSMETKTQIERMNDRISGLETQLKRPNMGNPAGDIDTKAAKKEKTDIYVKALQKGYSSLSAEEKSAIKLVGPGEAKALQSVDDTGGGYLAPVDFVQDIIKQIVLYSPIRDVATVRQTENKSILYPTRTATFAAQWVAEQVQRTETTGLKYGQEEILAHEMYALVLITYADMEDAYFDMSQQIQMEAAEQFAVTEGASFVNGNGVGKPEGLLTNTTVPSSVSGNASLLQADGLINCAYSLKSAYAKNAIWLMNRSTLGSVRTLKDSYGQYLWQPGIASDVPNTILDHPYVETPDMPAVAANAFPIIFGDIKRAYVIVDRVQMVMTRLTERYADFGQIGFIARKRVGGQVVLPEAILKHQIHT